jgi:hypothetical protein
MKMHRAATVVEHHYGPDHTDRWEIEMANRSNTTIASRRAIVAGISSLAIVAVPGVIAASAMPLPAIAFTAADMREARQALVYEEQGLFKICWHPRPFAYDYIYPDGRHRTLTTMDPDTQPMIEALRQLLWQRENGEAQS